MGITKAKKGKLERELVFGEIGYGKARLQFFLEYASVRYKIIRLIILCIGNDTYAKFSVSYYDLLTMAGIRFAFEELVLPPRGFG